MLRSPIHVLTAASACTAIFAATADATLIHDPFLSGTTPGNGEYADGARLDSANPTVTGFSGAWSDPTDRLDTTASGLTYAAGNISVGAGGSVIRRSDGGGTGTSNYSRTVTGSTSTDPGEAWFAMLVKAGQNDAGEVMTVAFDFDADTGGTDALVAGYAAGSFSLQGSSVGSIDTGETNLIIGRLTVVQTGTSGDGDEIIDFWVNPTDVSSAAQLTATAEYTSQSAGNYAFDTWGAGGVTIAAGGTVGSGNQVDEIMFADSLSDLQGGVLIPEPASLALLGLGSLLILGGRRRAA